LAYTIHAHTLTSAIGAGLEATNNSILSNRPGVTSAPWPGCDLSTWVGSVSEELLAKCDIPEKWESRNNRLALLALKQDGFEQEARLAVQQTGPDRCGLIIGTSTASIGETEHAYTRLDIDGRFRRSDIQSKVHNPHSTTAFIAEYLGVAGPAATISTACSSSAKAFANAARWLDCGLVDTVIVGGVDTLCLSVLYGFNSLQLVSEKPCSPFDVNRTGINLGEAGGYAIISKRNDASKPKLLGYGESTDAWHMSTPHPEGLGARLAMQSALQMARLETIDIDYLNLHGTGTRANDAVEGKTTAGLFHHEVDVSATKCWTGHTLGAAGITEAILCINAIQTSLIPGTITTTQPETELAPRVLLENTERTVRTAMSNSFGFGGNNCTLIIGAEAQ